MTLTAPPSGSLGGVLPGVVRALGGRGTADPLGLTALLGDVRQVAVLLVDGLGYHLLPAAAPHAPILADALAGRGVLLRELSSAFPSTTPTSLVTLGTGSLPGAHGVTGFTVRNPATDDVLTHVAWSDEPDPSTWQPLPRLLDRGDLSTAVVGPREYSGSGLSRAAYGDARYRGAARLARSVVRELNAGTQLVYGYHPTLDVTAHLHGIDSVAWRDAVADVGVLVTQIAERLPAGAALLVTADHGCLDVPLDGRFDLDSDSRLSDGVRLVAGEPRVRYLHTVNGATADVAAAWHAVLGDEALVLTRDEAIDGGWFGPVTPEHRGRIGDLVVVCRNRTVVLATAHEPPAVARLIGFHGAVTPEETAIPLAVWRR